MPVQRRTAKRAVRCNHLFGEPGTIASKLTLPHGYVRYFGPSGPFRRRTEHQAIVLPCEQALLISADKVGIRGALNVMRHGCGSLIHGVSAKVAKVAVERVLEFLGTSAEGLIGFERFRSDRAICTDIRPLLS